MQNAKKLIDGENDQEAKNINDEITNQTDDTQKNVEGAFGQTTSNSTSSLICDLTSPVIQGSTGRMEIVQTGDEYKKTGSVESYEWKIFSVDQNKYVSDKKSISSVRNIYYGTPGTYRIEVDILSDDNVFSTLKLEQTVVAEDRFLTSSIKNLPDSKTYRELVNDFNSYIIDAANLTGPNGITPRMLASVLKIEIDNRPKEGRTEEIENVKEN